MKKLLLSTIMLCCLFCEGQIPDTSYKRVYDVAVIDSGYGLSSYDFTKDSMLVLKNGNLSSCFILSPPVKIDTIPCVMIVSDTFKFDQYTTTHDTLRSEYGGWVISMGMKKSKLILNGVWQQQGYYIKRSDSFYVAYLDADKKKLDRNIVVWMSK